MGNSANIDIATLKKPQKLLMRFRTYYTENTIGGEIGLTCITCGGNSEQRAQLTIHRKLNKLHDWLLGGLKFWEMRENDGRW